CPVSPTALAVLAVACAALLSAAGWAAGRRHALRGERAAYGEIRADVLFVAANGFSTAHGLTTPDLAEAAVKRAAVAAARRVVLLADSAKHGQEHFARFGDLGDVDLLITDSALSPEDAAAIERAGTEVVRA
ncbi:hypothetical protein ACFXDC_29160, partial [Streptomyces misionensis]